MLFSVPMPGLQCSSAGRRFESSRAFKSKPAGVNQRGQNEDFRASALPPSCYSNDAEQAGAKEEERGGFGDTARLLLNITLSRIGPMSSPPLFVSCTKTFASRLVMNGVPLRTVQKLLGHKTIAMTERYSHMSDDHMDDAVEASIHYKNTGKIPMAAMGGSRNPLKRWHAREDSNLRPSDSKSDALSS